MKPTNQSTKSTDLKWSVMEHWNAMLNLTKQYPAKVRDYISPSDLGKDYWGRYQKMMGVEPTNPFEDRVLRIFAAGDEFHYLMRNVFKALGILKNSQDEPDKQGRNQWSVIPETEKTLKVLGKYDCLAGGNVNLEQIKRHCKEMNFSPFVEARTILMAEKLQEKYPNGLPDILYDFKSINSMAFWAKKDYLQEAYPHNVLQLYAYLVANNVQEGRLLYISKDDLTIEEFAVYLDTPKLKQKLQEDLEAMTYYIKAKEEPPKPSDYVFDEKAKIKFQRNKKSYVIIGSYVPNWEIERSQYFSLLTECKNVEEWQDKIKGKIKDLNDEIKDKYIKEKNI